LEPLSADQIEGLLRRALTDEERGIASMQVTVDAETLKSLANISGGAERIALNAIELAAQTARTDKKGQRMVTAAHVDGLQKRAAFMIAR
jgi:putative ATPase